MMHHRRPTHSSKHYLLQLHLRHPVHLLPFLIQIRNWPTAHLLRSTHVARLPSEIPVREGQLVEREREVEL